MMEQQEHDDQSLVDYFHSRFLAFFHYYFVSMPKGMLELEHCLWLGNKLDAELVRLRSLLCTY